MSLLDNLYKDDFLSFKEEIELSLLERIGCIIEDYKKAYADFIFNEEKQHTYSTHFYDDKDDKLKKIDALLGHKEIDDAMEHYLKNSKITNVLVKRNDGKEVHYGKTSDEKGNDYWDILHKKTNKQ